MTSDISRPACPHVLLLDDADTREMCAFALVRSGFRVSIAATVADALDQTRVLKPHVITTDLQGGPAGMRRMTQALKASDETRAIPIIVMTAWVESEDREWALRAGCASVLLKPCRVETLVAQIHRLLAAHFTRGPK
jgi:two-component system cell cycle response regulator DivK